MKAVMVMFDSLNRHYLPNYGCDWVKAPNFERLGKKAVTFDNSYCGSMPCMPARRDLHTGRYSFLHRSWGPIEPFDDSMPNILRDNGVYSHLVSDHYHYWEDGGATYHNRYSSWECVRGQEGDRWKGHVGDPEIPENINKAPHRQDWVNREYFPDEQSMPQAQTFNLGKKFIEKNHNEDNWFLQIETFDPHEPFFVQEDRASLYEDEYDGPFFDWPSYRQVSESKEAVEHVKKRYASLVSMCDSHLGKVLDLFDRYDLWEDTMLIVNTDHGFLLGEHNWWAKAVQHCYNEIAHTPLFIYDPRTPQQTQEHSRRSGLCQTIDLAPTLLSYFGITPPPHMEGFDLAPMVKEDIRLRDSIIFGFHGQEINWTDGKYLYMRAPSNPEIPPYNYTLMTTHMRNPFTIEELTHTELSQPFGFTKGVPVLKVPSPGGSPGGEPAAPLETVLFDIEQDPKQMKPLNSPEVEQHALNSMARLMTANEAPDVVFKRYGIPYHKN
jgi:arylsulfatase A-like enzyme